MSAVPQLPPGDPTRDARRRALREAITLPLLLLTSVLLASLRVASGTHALRFDVAPLIFLVLALLVIAVLVRSGGLSPEALMHPSRSPLENASGAVVLACLFAASAQLMHALTPETGLLHFTWVVFFALLFWNTLTARPDGPRAHRSLLVVFGSALVLKFVVLAALYDPRPSLTKRVITALMEGVSLGSVRYEPGAPVTGYAGFAALILYFVALVLLPKSRLQVTGDRLQEEHSVMLQHSHADTAQITGEDR